MNFENLITKFVIAILLIRRSWKNMKLLNKNSNIYMKYGGERPCSDQR